MTVFFPPVSTLTTMNLTVKFIAKCVGYYIHIYYMYSNWHKSVRLWRSRSTVLHTVSTVNTARRRIESNEHELVHPKRLFFPPVSSSTTMNLTVKLIANC